MPAEPSLQQPWQPHHTELTIRAIIAVVQSHRTEIYKTPGLAGEVDGHGGDRIRQKIEQILKGMAMANGLEAGAVREGATKRKGADLMVNGETKAKRVKKEEVFEESH